MNPGAPPAPPERFPVRLNLGCGYDRREGFLNVDLQHRHNPDMVADVTALPQLPSDHFELIVAQDVLEHLERQKVPLAVAEWSRLLAAEGMLEIRVPSLLDLLVMLGSPASRSAARAEEVIHLLYGTQAYSGDYHLSGFTAETLDALMSKTGLLICEASLLHGWLFELRARRTDVLASDKEFVHHAYFQILGRPADAGGLEAFSEALSSGRLSRTGVREALATSEEARFLAHQPRYLLPYATRLLAEEGTGGAGSLNARLEMLEAEVAAMRASRSWRATAPFRSMLTRFRRVRGT
jgi:hypothetical protein